MQEPLFGRYNIGSVLLNYGSLTLAGEAVVTSSRIASDTANGLNGSGIGVIDNRGEKAVFTLSGGKITRNALNDDSIVYSGIVRASDGAKVIITGDQSQKDLPYGTVSGLDTALKILKNIDDIGICYFTSDDVVRHPLVQKIVKAYDEYEARGKGAKKPDRQAGRDGRNDSNHRV